MRLFIIRHGQTSWNVQGLAQGHTDIPLDDVGLEQARALAAGFEPGCSVQKVYTSDLLRAHQTAEILARRLGADLIVRPALRERCFGDYEGLHYLELRRRLNEDACSQGLSSDEVTPPNAETMQEFWDRLTPVQQELEALEEPAVVVGHGGTATLLLAKLMRGNIEVAKALTFGNTGCTVMEKRGEGLYRMVLYNDTSHLGRSAVLNGGVESSVR
jgi:2,3-bisphosphoglycerate-dependent phosphoglycerate mutase